MPSLAMALPREWGCKRFSTACPGVGLAGGSGQSLHPGNFLRSGNPSLAELETPLQAPVPVPAWLLGDTRPRGEEQQGRRGPQKLALAPPVEMLITQLGIPSTFLIWDPPQGKVSIGEVWAGAGAGDAQLVPGSQCSQCSQQPAASASASRLLGPVLADPVSGEAVVKQCLSPQRAQTRLLGFWPLS